MRPHGARELAHPEASFYIAGMKSYGRAPTFLMMTGYEQVRSIAAEIAGDQKLARRRAGAARDRRVLGSRSGGQSRRGRSERGRMLRRPGAGADRRRDAEPAAAWPT